MLPGAQGAGPAGLTIVETCSPHARYAVVSQTPAGWSAELRCVAYDFEPMAKKAYRARGSIGVLGAQPGCSNGSRTRNSYNQSTTLTRDIGLRHGRKLTCKRQPHIAPRRGSLAHWQPTHGGLAATTGLFELPCANFAPIHFDEDGVGARSLGEGLLVSGGVRRQRVRDKGLGRYGVLFDYPLDRGAPDVIPVVLGEPRRCACIGFLRTKID